MDMLMEGVKILSKEEIVTTTNLIKVYVLLSFFGIFIGVAVMQEFDNLIIGLFVTVLIFVICVFLMFNLPEIKHHTEKYNYIVEISENTDLTLLYKNYDVGKSEKISGKTIYHITDKYKSTYYYK
jgi:hypothetical protein